MKKYSYIGKTREEAINTAKISLQENEDNLIIIEKEIKQGIFKTKKIEIDVIEKREIIKYIKDYLYNILKDLGFNINIEVRKNNEIPIYIIYSDNDSLLIGKGGKNLQALSIIISQVVKKEIGKTFKFLLDVNDYKEKQVKNIERLARQIAKEVKQTKIEAKLDPMNSYERRIIHNTLVNNKYVYTESIGEEPNRYVIIKPKEN